jgi:hypothetical protein
MGAHSTFWFSLGFKGPDLGWAQVEAPTGCRQPSRMDGINVFGGCGDQRFRARLPRCSGLRHGSTPLFTPKRPSARRSCLYSVQPLPPDVPRIPGQGNHSQRCAVARPAECRDYPVDICPVDIFAQRQHVWIAHPTPKALNQKESRAAVHHAAGSPAARSPPLAQSPTTVQDCCPASMLACGKLGSLSCRLSGSEERPHLWPFGAKISAG